MGLARNFFSSVNVSSLAPARRAGLSGFCYYHYWFSGRRLMNLLSRDWRRIQPWRRFDTYHDMAAFSAFDICQPPPAYTCFPGVCPSWDNTARRAPGKGIIFTNSAPRLFQDWLSAKIRSFRPGGDANSLFINAWNEWA